GAAYEAGSSSFPAHIVPSRDFAEDLADLLAVLEIAEAVVALDRGAQCLPLVFGVAAFDRVQHPPIVPDHHVGGLPVMPIGGEAIAQLVDFVAYLVIDRLEFGGLVMLDAHRHPRADMQ